MNEMNTENVVLMRMARESLSGKWGLAIGTFVVYLLAIGCISLILLGVIVAGPMALGLAVFSLSLARNQEARLEQIFVGFRKFGTSLLAYLLSIVFIILWMLVPILQVFVFSYILDILGIGIGVWWLYSQPIMIIPGIIAAISYSMTFYIIADDDSIGAMAAIDKSKLMMNGYKWKYFRLGLRFLGLALLCILTLGIGFLWLAPYMQVTMAKFYDDIKYNHIAM